MWFIVALAMAEEPASRIPEPHPPVTEFMSVSTSYQLVPLCVRQGTYEQSGRIAIVPLASLPRGYQIQPERSMNLVIGVGPRFPTGEVRWLLDGATFDHPSSLQGPRTRPMPFDRGAMIHPRG